jgi:hypothetical protein
MTVPNGDSAGARTGSIYDLGYRHYEGKRNGRALRNVVALRRKPPRRVGLSAGR